jgi:phage tail tape-measure protein
MVDTRFQDGRAQRRDLTGIGAGVAAGALAGLALGWLLHVGSLVGATLGALLGAAAGALVGRLVVRRVNTDDWDPLPSRRSHVGVKTPDTDVDREPSVVREPARS